MSKINFDDVVFKSFTADDIEPFADYLCNCSEEFLKSFGADKKKVPPKEVLMQDLKEKLDNTGIIKSMLIGIYQGRRIGHANINNIVANESAIIHGQIWDSKLRGIGIGPSSLIKACEYFLNEWNLKKIIFKIPVINVRANRVMEKLGFVNLGTVVYEFSMMIEPINCHLYEIDLTLLDILKKKLP